MHIQTKWDRGLVKCSFYLHFRERDMEVRSLSSFALSFLVSFLYSLLLSVFFYSHFLFPYSSLIFIPHLPHSLPSFLTSFFSLLLPPSHALPPSPPSPPCSPHSSTITVRLQWSCTQSTSPWHHCRRSIRWFLCPQRFCGLSKCPQAEELQTAHDLPTICRVSRIRVQNKTKTSEGEFVWSFLVLHWVMLHWTMSYWIMLYWMVH